MVDTARLDRLFGAATDAGRVPGLVAILAGAEGVRYQGAFGRRSLADPAPMTLDTVFAIASMTKAITAAAAMQLVEQGKLSLDAPAAEVCPGLANKQVLEGFAPDGTPRLRPARGVITLRHLMTHTAGFGYDMWNPLLARMSREHGLVAARTGQLKALDAPLTFDPGTRWQYGINIDWIGRMVEAASGLNLEAYFQGHLFAPLGMKDTSFLVRPDMEARRVTRHQRAADGTLSVNPFEPNPKPEFFPGGGGLFSTGPDYIRFLRALLGGGALDGARVLRPETVATMGRDHMAPLRMEVMPTQNQAVTNNVDLFPSVPKGWGLSFLVNLEATPSGRKPGGLAWAGINNTWFWLDPARGTCAVLMTQILPFADGVVLELLDEFERAVNGIV
jgi:CubicO group peptidase (beta-lactamase class C family)